MAARFVGDCDEKIVRTRFLFDFIFPGRLRHDRHSHRSTHTGQRRRPTRDGKAGSPGSSGSQAGSSGGRCGCHEEAEDQDQDTGHGDMHEKDPAALEDLPESQPVFLLGQVEA